MDDYLPISMLNQLLYCPRRFWYIHVLGEMEINAPVLEGTLLHEHAHTPGRETDDRGRPVRRRVHLWSDRLGLIGFADLVELAGGALLPVEFKHGRQGRWDNDAVQLCAQALCLEEMTGRGVARGEIFYWGSRHRVEVVFDDALRAQTEAAVAQARALLAAGQMPPPLRGTRAPVAAKCHSCSLEPICLPAEMARLGSPAPAARRAAGGKP